MIAVRVAARRRGGDPVEPDAQGPRPEAGTGTDPRPRRCRPPRVAQGVRGQGLPRQASTSPSAHGRHRARDVPRSPPSTSATSTSTPASPTSITARATGRGLCASIPKTLRALDRYLRALGTPPVRGDTEPVAGAPRPAHPSWRRRHRRPPRPARRHRPRACPPAAPHLRPPVPPAGWQRGRPAASRRMGERRRDAPLRIGPRRRHRALAVMNAVDPLGSDRRRRRRAPVGPAHRPVVPVGRRRPPPTPAHRGGARGCRHRPSEPTR